MYSASRFTMACEMKLIGPNTVFAGMALTFAILLAGCGKSGSKSNTGTSTDPQILHLGNGTEPAGLDPHLVTGVPENKIISSLLEGLIAYHPTDDLQPEPGMAERWESNEENNVAALNGCIRS